MKKTFINSILRIIFVTIIGGLSIISCTKDNYNSDYNQMAEAMSSKGGDSDIPFFNNYQQLYNTIAEAIDCGSISELMDYETSQGRESIGTLSDYFYESINQNSFSSEKEALDFYADNISMIDTTMDGGQILISPKYYNTVYRYVANVDGLFAVNGRLYRLFKTSIVSVEINLKNALLALSEEDIATVDTTIFHVEMIPTAQPLPISATSQITHSNCSSQWSFSDTKQSGNDRVTIELNTSINTYGNIGSMFSPQIHVYSRHKWAGIWWICKHNLTCQGSFAYHYKDNNNIWVSDSFSINQTQSSTSWWIQCDETPCYNGIGSDYYHYASIHLNARTPSLGYAQIVLN